jgi:hypothetical protein
MIERRKLAQDLRQVGRAELPRSTGGGHLLRQAHRLFESLASAPYDRGAAAHTRFHAVSVSRGRFSRRTSPMRTVTPSRSKYSSSGITYFLLV